MLQNAGHRVSEALLGDDACGQERGTQTGSPAEEGAQPLMPWSRGTGEGEGAPPAEIRRAIWGSVLPCPGPTLLPASPRPHTVAKPSAKSLNSHLPRAAHWPPLTPPYSLKRSPHAPDRRDVRSTLWPPEPQPGSLSSALRSGFLFAGERHSTKQYMVNSILPQQRELLPSNN